MDAAILKDKKTLVVEDNPINQMVVKHSLIKLGGQVEITNDGAEAIERLKTNQYDLILMDIQMPIVDGYETTQYIRNQLKSNVPIVAMTAFALKGEDEKCYESGMNGYIAKPFTIESLQKEISKVMNNSSELPQNPYLLSTNEVAVDVSMLYEISGDDEDYIKMMVVTFLDNMPVTIERMENHLEQKDWDSLAKAAHYAKSSLSVIKITGMLDWVQQIERNAKNKTALDTLDKMVADVKARFAVSQQLLQAKFVKETHKEAV